MYPVRLSSSTIKVNKYRGNALDNEILLQEHKHVTLFYHTQEFWRFPI